MSISVSLALQEVGSGWARTVLKGIILICAIGTQLFSSLAAAASQDAVETYGVAVFGYGQTHRAEVSGPLTLESVAGMDATLDEILRAHPWAVLAFNVTTTAALTTPASPLASPETTFTVASIHGPWRSISATMGRSAAFGEVQAPAAPPRVVVPSAVAQRLGVGASGLVTITAPDSVVAAPEDPAHGSQSRASEAVSSESDPVTVVHQPLPDVPAFRGRDEQNKSLVSDALVSRSVLFRLGAAPEGGAMYWRCSERTCPDLERLASLVASSAGAKLSPAVRIDAQPQMEPVLRQQREQALLFSWVAIVLGTCAVTVVATALVEVRTPELFTLRMLGARRSTLFAAALIEGVVVAVLVGVASVVVAAVAAKVDPNLFNHIDAVVLERFDPPVALLARTMAVTLGVGVLTGLLPAVRVYRLVRAS